MNTGASIAIGELIALLQREIKPSDSQPILQSIQKALLEPNLHPANKNILLSYQLYLSLHHLDFASDGIITQLTELNFNQGQTGAGGGVSCFFDDRCAKPLLEIPLEKLEFLLRQIPPGPKYLTLETLIKFILLKKTLTEYSAVINSKITYVLDLYRQKENLSAKARQYFADLQACQFNFTNLPAELKPTVKEWITWDYYDDKQGHPLQNSLQDNSSLMADIIDTFAKEYHADFGFERAFAEVKEANKGWLGRYTDCEVRDLTLLGRCYYQKKDAANFEACFKNGAKLINQAMLLIRQKSLSNCSRGLIDACEAYLKTNMVSGVTQQHLSYVLSRFYLSPTQGNDPSLGVRYFCGVLSNFEQLDLDALQSIVPFFDDGTFKPLLVDAVFNNPQALEKLNLTGFWKLFFNHPTLKDFLKQWDSFKLVLEKLIECHFFELPKLVVSRSKDLAFCAHFESVEWLNSHERRLVPLIESMLTKLEFIQGIDDGELFNLIFRVPESAIPAILTLLYRHDDKTSWARALSAAAQAYVLGGDFWSATGLSDLIADSAFESVLKNLCAELCHKSEFEKIFKIAEFLEAHQRSAADFKSLIDLLTKNVEHTLRIFNLLPDSVRLELLTLLNEDDQYQILMNKQSDVLFVPGGLIEPVNKLSANFQCGPIYVRLQATIGLEKIAEIVFNMACGKIKSDAKGCWKALVEANPKVAEKILSTIAWSEELFKDHNDSWWELLKALSIDQVMALSKTWPYVLKVVVLAQEDYALTLVDMEEGKQLLQSLARSLRLTQLREISMGYKNLILKIYLVNEDERLYQEFKSHQKELKIFLNTLLSHPVKNPSSFSPLTLLLLALRQFGESAFPPGSNSSPSPGLLTQLGCLNDLVDKFWLACAKDNEIKLDGLVSEVADNFSLAELNIFHDYRQCLGKYSRAIVDEVMRMKALTIKSQLKGGVSAPGSSKDAASSILPVSLVDLARFVFGGLDRLEDSPPERAELFELYINQTDKMKFVYDLYKGLQDLSHEIKERIFNFILLRPELFALFGVLRDDKPPVGEGEIQQINDTNQTSLFGLSGSPAIPNYVITYGINSVFPTTLQPIPLFWDITSVISKASCSAKNHYLFLLILNIHRSSGQLSETRDDYFDHIMSIVKDNFDGFTLEYKRLLIREFCAHRQLCAALRLLQANVKLVQSPLEETKAAKVMTFLFENKFFNGLTEDADNLEDILTWWVSTLSEQYILLHREDLFLNPGNPFKTILIKKIISEKPREVIHALDYLTPESRHGVWSLYFEQGGLPKPVLTAINKPIAVRDANTLDPKNAEKLFFEMFEEKPRGPTSSLYEHPKLQPDVQKNLATCARKYWETENNFQEKVVDYGRNCLIVGIALFFTVIVPIIAIIAYCVRKKSYEDEFKKAYPIAAEKWEHPIKPKAVPLAQTSSPPGSPTAILSALGAGGAAASNTAAAAGCGSEVPLPSPSPVASEAEIPSWVMVPPPNSQPVSPWCVDVTPGCLP